jgi:hypothetical protein
MVNVETAARFLHMLDPAHCFTFQTFADRGNEPVASLARVLHGSFAEHTNELVALNEEGAGIFVMVNAGDGVIRSGHKTCRTGANVVRIRSLFVDLDGAPIAPALSSALPPDWIVQSSRDRWHAYWMVDDCPLDGFGPAQAALALRFEGDPSVKDLPRVMRVPGFLHRKGEPFLSELYLPADYQQILETRHD